MIFTNRYWKTWYQGHQWAHSITGYIMGLATLYGVWQAFNNRRHRVVFQYHPMAGFATFFMCDALIIMGMIAMIRRKFITPKDWESQKARWWSNVHSYAAYFIIFFSQVTVSLGMAIYWKGTMQTALGVTYMLINFIGFWGILAVAECIHRCRLRREDPFTKVQATMTEKEFNMHVNQGRKL